MFVFSFKLKPININIEFSFIDYPKQTIKLQILHFHFFIHLHLPILFPNLFTCVPINTLVDFGYISKSILNISRWIPLLTPRKWYIIYLFLLLLLLSPHHTRRIRWIIHFTDCRPIYGCRLHHRHCCSLCRHPGRTASPRGRQPARLRRKTKQATNG